MHTRDCHAGIQNCLLQTASCGNPSDEFCNCNELDPACVAPFHTDVSDSSSSPPTFSPSPPGTAARRRALAAATSSSSVEAAEPYCVGATTVPATCGSTNCRRTAAATSTGQVRSTLSRKSAPCSAVGHGRGLPLPANATIPPAAPCGYTRGATYELQTRAGSLVTRAATSTQLREAARAAAAHWPRRGLRR